MLERARTGIAALILVILLALSACGSGAPCTPLLDAILEDDLDIVQEHMESGTDPNRFFVWTGNDYEGASALHLAVSLEHKEIAELLLKNGADINLKARDQYEGTPLHWAAYLGHKQMVKWLVEAEADINATDINGYTPLDATASNPDLDPDTVTEIADYLRENGARTSD